MLVVGLPIGARRPARRGQPLRHVAFNVGYVAFVATINNVLLPSLMALLKRVVSAHGLMLFEHFIHINMRLPRGPLTPWIAGPQWHRLDDPTKSTLSSIRDRHRMLRNTCKPALAHVEQGPVQGKTDQQGNPCRQQHE